MSQIASVKYMFLLLVFHFFVWLIEGACPNMCSGHGDCGFGNVCTCYSGYNGGAPDCSFRECGKGIAWVDKAYAIDKAHQLAECSNAGLCDRTTGQCQCFSGFYGPVCNRMGCPNECSGNGVCMSIRDVSVYQGPDTLTGGGRGDGLGVDYLNWERNSLMMCKCDDSYFGPDCSQVRLFIVRELCRKFLC